MNNRLSIIPLSGANVGNVMQPGQLAIDTTEKPKLMFKDKQGTIHCLTDDSMRVEVIKKLAFDNVRVIRA